jgi:hypothetical protein
MARRNRDDPYELVHRIACLDMPEAADTPLKNAADLLHWIAMWGDHRGRYFAKPYRLWRMAISDERSTIALYVQQLMDEGEVTIEPLGLDCYGGSVIDIICPQRLERWNRFSRRRPMSAAVRRQVFARDDYACRHCGRRSDLAVDHIFPWSLGGTDDLDNLQTLCRPCNSRKGARTDALVPSR